MSVINETILLSTETVSEFDASGAVRVWVYPVNGTWASGETVKLQEWLDFEGVTGAWADDPSPDAIWTAEDKKFLALCKGRRYRLLASATGFVARADTYTGLVLSL